MEEIGRDPNPEGPQETTDKSVGHPGPFNRIEQHSPDSEEEIVAPPTDKVQTLLGFVILAVSLLSVSLNSDFGYINVVIGCTLAVGGFAKFNLLKK